MHPQNLAAGSPENKKSMAYKRPLVSFNKALLKEPLFLGGRGRVRRGGGAWRIIPVSKWSKWLVNPHL